MIPVNACTALIYLWLAINNYWSDTPDPAVLAGQVQTESCITVKHKRCWDARSELKTKREYGFGLGQVTIAYNKNGTVRFNKWAELRQQFKEPLNKWTWENRYDPEMQLTAMVLMMKDGYLKYPDAANDVQRLKFTLAGYNGGNGAILKDIGLCRKTKGCNPSYWDNNVALHSFKSRKPLYGNRSAYDINREYPQKVFKAADNYRQYTPIQDILDQVAKTGNTNLCD